jgi:hypothetical protein
MVSIRGLFKNQWQFFWDEEIKAREREREREPPHVPHKVLSFS